MNRLITPTTLELQQIAAGNPQGFTQRWSYGIPSWRHVSEGGFRRSRYDVVALAEAPARRFIEHHHYLAGWPAALHRLGLLDLESEQLPGQQRIGGAELVGVLVLACPMNRRVLSQAFPALVPYTQSAELARLVLLDEVPANAESFFIAAALRLAATAGIRGVVSFSDPVPRARRTDTGKTISMPGHLGICYQACNFRYTGRGTPRTLTVLPDGSVLTARSRAKITGNEVGAAGVTARLLALGAPPPIPGDDPRTWLTTSLRVLGARSVRHPGNHRYALAVGRTRAERTGTTIALAAAPYPKHHSPLPPSWC